ncbi:MAG TPA: oligosaccharide flippase family protein, partial [Fermentimonas sp.]|nr:oligosaccharide flippase family protein [Fermentimonas sp.]
GVWALVLKQILESVISFLLLWISSKWRPSLIFSKQSFISLFGFSSKLLAASLYGTTLVEINNIVIGKVYSSANLGYYNRAKGFAELTAGTITSVLSQVTFPILASLQNDKEKLVQVFRRLIMMSAFLIFPSITLLSLIVDPFIRFFLTDKWIPAIVLSQWFAFAKLFYPIGVINLNILNAVGRSDLFLKVDLSKLPMILIALIITIPIGVKAIVIGQVITSFISFFINAYMPGKMFNYGGLSQIRDMLPIILSTFIMAVFVYFSMYFIDSLILKMVVGIITGIVIYWIAVTLLKVDEVKEVKNLLRRHVFKKRLIDNSK